MKHAPTTTVMLIAMSIGATAEANLITLDFSAPTGGTLKDKNGFGTGFTHRMPGSGSGIPADDPNLELDTPNSRLIIQSSRSDFNTTGYGQNLAALEAPSLFVAGLGSDDFLVEASMLNVQVNELSDQLGIFAGSSVDLVFRGGVHEFNTSPNYMAFFFTSENGADRIPAGAVIPPNPTFDSGDDALFRLGRIGGQWFFYWENLTTGWSEQSAYFTDSNLDAINDFYFGVFNNDARNTTSQNMVLEKFTLRTGNSVPEPSTLAILFIGACLGLVCRRIRS